MDKNFISTKESPVNLAIVGSRGFTDVTIVRRSIQRMLELHPDLTIVSGGAQGADSIGAAIAKEFGLPTLIHLPQWERLGKKAGFVRNELIVRDADVVLAFFADGPKSRGTAHTVSLATGKKPLYVYHEGAWETPAQEPDEADLPGCDFCGGEGHYATAHDQAEVW